MQNDMPNVSNVFTMDGKPYQLKSNAKWNVTYLHDFKTIANRALRINLGLLVLLYVYELGRYIITDLMWCLKHKNAWYAIPVLILMAYVVSFAISGVVHIANKIKTNSYGATPPAQESENDLSA